MRSDSLVEEEARQSHWRVAWSLYRMVGDEKMLIVTTVGDLLMGEVEQQHLHMLLGGHLEDLGQLAAGPLWLGQSSGVVDVVRLLGLSLLA